MPIFQLNETLVFPHPSQADPDGILAIGGDLSPQRLLLAYSNGIFPWFEDESPILWWSPDPRTVLYPQKIRAPKSMRKLLHRETFTVTFDNAFGEVMEACGQVERKGQEGTWITESMLEAYHELHHNGLAHSVEVWKEGKLVGGLYGVCLGQCFFGESMFSLESNASKAAFYHLMELLKDKGIGLVDCQVKTDHLISLGAEEISRTRFLEELEAALQNSVKSAFWGDIQIDTSRWKVSPNP